MPNTPPANRLRRIVARAEREHGHVEAATAARADDGATTRRGFLTQAGTAAAGAAALGTFAQPARAAAGQKVVVVGAGLAGLTCAHRLKQAGIVAELHEANDRVGGRVWTRYEGFAPSQITERGGELIDTGHTELRRLIREMDLELLNLLAAEARGTEPSYFFDGSSYSDAQATQDYLEVREQLRADVKAAGYPTTYRESTPRGRQLDAMSVAQYIDAVVPGGRASSFGQLLDVAYTIEYGAESSDQSALNLLYLLGYSTRGFEIFGESDEKFKIEGGNDQLVDRLENRLSEQITRESELVRIRHLTGGGYDLDFRRGSTTRSVRADRVVLALPFSILRSSVDYSQADFRPLKRRAIREQGMGQNTKLHVGFSNRYWSSQGSNGETFSDTGYQNTWDATRGQPGQPGILVDYTGGDYAVSLLGNPDTLARRFCGQLEPVLPGAIARYNGRAKLDHWPSNPWTRGSYSYWKVGQYQQFAGVEGEPENQAHFCGEHTSIDFQGFMNGAVETGERAATEVIQALR